MKLSELIKIAQKQMEEHGDAIVTCYTGSQRVTEVTSIGVKFRNKTKSIILRTTYWSDNFPEKQKGEMVFGIE
jgi:hypothetical protein